MARDVMRLWLNCTIDGDEAPFYVKEFKNLGDMLNLDIELKFFSWNRSVENLVEAFKSGHGPDVFQLGTTYIHTVAHLGYLSPVPDSIVQKKALAPWMSTCLTYGGKKIGVPWFGDTVIMAARQDILDKHGIKPEDVSNWESFNRVCMELSAYSKSVCTSDDIHFPLIFRIRPESDTFWYYVSWLWSAGWRFPSMIPVPDRILNDDAAIRTFEYIFKLMENSGITTKDVSIHPQHMFEQFHNQGRYVFYIGNWGGPLANIVKNSLNSYASDASSSYTIMPLPTATPNARPWSGGSALVVSKGTKNQESAWNLVEYLISDDFIKKWTSVSGDVPAYECPFWERNASDANLKVLRSQMEKSDTFPFHPMWYSIEKKFEDGIANLLWSTLEGKTPVTLENIRSGFVETDRNVCELLKMSWEMVDGD